MANKNIGTGSLFLKTAKSIFMRVSGTRYDSMEERALRKGFYGGLPFSKDSFRIHLLRAMGGSYDGFLRCQYCNGYFSLEQIAIDHAVPLARGGGVDLGNLEFPCKPCNARKGEMKPDEYLALLEFLDTRIPLAKTDVLQRLEISVQLATGQRHNAATIAELKRTGDWQKARSQSGRLSGRR